MSDDENDVARDDAVDETSDAGVTEIAAAAPSDPSPSEPVAEMAEMAEMAEDSTNSTRAFLATHRAQADEAASGGAGSGESAGSVGPKRSGALILLACVIAAQVLAGGVYLALRTLQDDPVVEVAEAPEATAVPTEPPTPRPSTAPTPTRPPTPTAVAPTPEWTPESEGPRSSPFTFIATITDGVPTLFDAPDGAEFEPSGAPLANPWPSGSALRFRVVSGEPTSGWIQVATPGSETELAWLPNEGVEWSTSNRLVQIDVTANLVRVFEGNDVIFVAAAATGDRANPTPRLQSWVVENPAGDQVESAAPVLSIARDRAGGASLQILPAVDDSAIGDYVTDGEVWVGLDEARQLARLVPTGSKVEVMGVPIAPTPTPRPIPTPRPGDDEPVDELVDTRCPSGAFGNPPDCYRVVQRDEFPGECPGFQVPIDRDCWSLGGDPWQDFGKQPECPAGAPELIDDRCYTYQGPRPTEYGDCPPEATEVADECRVPA